MTQTQETAWEITVASAPPFDAHAHSEDKDRVQDDVDHGSDQYGEHTGFRISLCGDEHIHSKCHLDENGSDGVDVHVIGCVTDGIFTGAECQKDRAGSMPEESRSER